MNRILIYDPNVELLHQYKQALEQKLYWVVATADLAEAKKLMTNQFFHVCIWSIDATEDVSILYESKNLRPQMAIVASSQSSHSSLIVKCMRAGASHFWNKNSNLDELYIIISETLSRTVPKESSGDEMDFPLAAFVGRHPNIQKVFKLIMSIKDTDSTVLITGESGTGKEVVARAIHDLSPRKKHPWVAVNCSAIPANLLESELFGHTKGAFTGAVTNRSGRFQLASSGTLFLDEISDLSFDLQAKILRAIQNRVYEPLGSPHSVRLDARIIAATNQNLEKAVLERRFREDLFYRLNVIPIYIPPLRERKSDIPLLVQAFLKTFCDKYNKAVLGTSEDAMRYLMQYQWPGNIRELENLMERVVVLKTEGSVIEPKDLPVQHFRNVRVDHYVANVALPEEGLDFNEAVNDFENELILQALHKTEGNKNKAATLLNLNRTTLVEKLKRKGLKIAS